MHLARRLSAIQPSQTLAISAKAKAMRAQGTSVINFAAGEPDFDTPEHIKAAAIQAIHDGKTKYTPSSGMPELRQAICDRLAADRGLQYQASQVIVSNGAKHAIWNVLQAVCDSGDEVLIPGPYWVSYPPIVHLVEGVPKVLPTTEATGFKITPEQLAAAITSKTRVLILNSPSNPTGAVYSQTELQALGAVLEAHDIYILSDEIYEHLVFAPATHDSIAQVCPALIDRTIVVSGVSKSYAMTGWRIGYLAGPAHVAEAINRAQSHGTSNPSSISQYAALAALTGPQQELLAPMVAKFLRRRDVLVQGLDCIAGLSCVMPDGAFYVFCNISGLEMDSMVVGNRWLEEACVATVPGAAFGSDVHMRFSYATDEASITDGVQRIERWIQEHACVTS